MLVEEHAQSREGTVVTTDSLIPPLTHPFFIVTPPYTRVSAGVTALHLLCHFLNRAGYNAYIVQYPPAQGGLRSLPAYVTLQQQPEFPASMLVPNMTQDVLDFYHEQRLHPIVIYPEVFDNPLRAKFFGRYILNYPGRLNKAYTEQESFSVAYTRALAEYCTTNYPHHAQVTDVLFMPTVDLSYWNTSGSAAERNGVCFYAGKLKDIHYGAPPNVPDGAVEILRSQQMSRNEVRRIFWQSRYFLCYEDTALALEAQLCGCPTVFVPNKHFGGVPLAHHEMGEDGSCRYGDASGLAHAQATVGGTEAILRRHIDEVPHRIAQLGLKWLELARTIEYRGPIRYPFEPRLVFFDQSFSKTIGFEEGRTFAATRPMRAGVAGLPQRVGNLIRQTLSDGGGVRAVWGRTRRGIAKHGLKDFILLLCGVPPRDTN